MKPEQNNRAYPKGIYKNVLEAIGNTPLIRINNINLEEDIECDIVAKCEYFNAGGSIKDRIGLRMIEEAERSGLLTKGKSTIIEPTSGNTGIGLALASAVKGYRTIITMPEKMSNEKVNTLKALGAVIYRTPTEAAWNDPNSHISLAERLSKSELDAHILDQYSNPNNPLAHYYGTAQELWEQTQGQLDMVVIGAGTGGTISGIAKRLKELNSDIIIVGVDPVGSLLAGKFDGNQKSTESYQVEGIGYDFVPEVLDRSLIDIWIKTNDSEAFSMARRLIRSEGLLCGGSSGSAMHAALKAIKHYNFRKGKRVAVILPDSIRNYMSKFLNDDWMLLNGYIKPNGIVKQNFNNLQDVPTKKVSRVLDVSTHSEIILALKEERIVPVQDSKSGQIIGVLELELFLNRVLRAPQEYNVKSLMTKDIAIVSSIMRLNQVSSYICPDIKAILIRDENTGLTVDYDGKVTLVDMEAMLDHAIKF